MTPANIISNSANLVSAAASLVGTSSSTPTDQPKVQIPLSALPPVFIELNGTLVNLRDISLIRKANNKSKCFVIFLKQGIHCQTANYERQTDFIKDAIEVDRALTELSSKSIPTVPIPTFELPPAFINLNGTLVNLRDISLIRKANDKSQCFVIILKQGIRCQTANYEFKGDFIRDYFGVISRLQTL